MAWYINLAYKAQLQEATVFLYASTATGVYNALKNRSDKLEFKQGHRKLFFNRRYSELRALLNAILHRQMRLVDIIFVCL